MVILHPCYKIRLVLYRNIITVHTNQKIRILQMMLRCKRLHKFLPRRYLRLTLRCFSRKLQLSIMFVSMSAMKFINIVLQPNIVGTTDRVTGGVSRGQFGTVRLKFKLSTYVQETVGGR